ncbi:MAG: family 1 glycosylhydrolase, partial [Rhodospirillales bacterium]|nr:family 1 glycosylhydrolase [Rhodospirillales bacterium]
MESLQFGPNFNFGISTSAYQIEGAVHEGGRAPSIWDVFCHEPHHITDGDTADV